MPNTLATLALFAWPLVTVALFRALPVPKAIVVSIVGGYLLLPVEPAFNLPLLPTYGKELAAVLPAFVMAVLVTTGQPTRAARQTPVTAAPGPRAGLLPRSPLLRLCFFALLAGAMLTVLANGDPIVFETRSLPGLSSYDAGSEILTTLMLLLPFLLARKYLARPEDHATLIAVLAAAALAYSLPALWEVRMSPRLNFQIYGFFPHDWAQHLRAGGFRPVVFLEHGLRLGLFLAIGLIAMALAIRLGRGPWRVLAAGGFLWLLATLVLAKSLSAFLVALVIVPLALVLRPRMQLLAAALVAAAVLVYPMMRAGGLVPVQGISGAIATFADIDRLRSLEYRFINEDLLLEKAAERPLLGWGGWGRARIYNEAGRDISTTDGRWIIEFGEKGWVGYLATFGLLTAPVLLLAFRHRGEPVTLATSGVALLLAGNLLDLVPNSGLTPLTWLMAGALAGRLEARAAADADEAKAGAEAAPGRRRPAYRRPLSGKVQPSEAAEPQRTSADRPPATASDRGSRRAPEPRSPVTGVRLKPRRAGP